MNRLRLVFNLLAMSINSKNNNGNSPLITASKNGHKEIAELLIAKGADRCVTLFL